MGPLAPGFELAGYRIVSVVGRGGMGVVYRALEVELGRVVALKVIAAELLGEPTVRERFLQEARTAASIEHPNVIPVYAAGERDGIAYLAMRLVDGHDLRTLVQRAGPLAPARAAVTIARVAEALDAIHRAGYVHRDVKPANVLIDHDGHVYLSDFGLAKQMLTRGGATATGQWVGTLDYVAPEQIRGGAVDARADVYALGGVLAFVLTQQVPFDRDSDEAKLWAQLNDPPPVPSQLRPGLPAGLDAVVARAMAKAPDERYPSAGDLARALSAAVTGAAPSEPERMVARGAAAPASAEVSQDASTVTAGTVRAPRRRRGLLVGAPVLLGALAVAAFFALNGGGEAKRPPARTATMQTFHVGPRPNGVALAGGAVFVTSHDLPDLERFDARTGERLGATRIGAGATSIVADGGGVWVAVKPAHEVVRVDAAGTVTARVRPGAAPTRIAVGLGSLWVAVSWTDGTDLLLRFGPDGRERHRTPFPHGINALTTGQGYVWVAEAQSPNVVRVDPRDDRAEPWVTLADSISDLSEGNGYLWATLARADSVARVTPGERGGRITTSVGHRPLRTVAAGGREYVTVNLDHTVKVLDPPSGTPTGKTYRVPPNPYAIAADARALWITGLGKDTLTRIAYR